MGKAAQQEAINKIIELINTHGINIDDIATKLKSETSSAPEKNKTITATLFNYIGGIFALSGIALLIGIMWDDIASAQRVILTFGIGLCAFIMGIGAIKDKRFERTSTPLFLVSALMQPIGLFVFLNEYFPDGGDPVLAAIIIFLVMTIQQGLVFRALHRTSLLFCAFFFWNCFLGTGMEWLDIDGEFIGIVISISMLSLSYTIEKTSHNAITPPYYFIGGATLLVSWWALFEGSILDLSYLGLNAFLIYFSIIASSRSLLLVTILGLLTYMSYFTSEYFADVIGWPICLIILGLAMMAVSTHALKLGHKIRNKANTNG